MYAGTAAGNKSAHSNKNLKGKLYLVTTHADDMPKIKLNIPTPAININVLNV